MSRGALVNPHQSAPAGPLSLFAGGWRERRLIGQLIRREVLSRYRGSIMGVAWSFLHPLVMLAVYTFVFTVVFEARWPGALAGTERSRFALLIFIGVIAHGFLAEAITKAPGVIVGNANYVKKVVFPLETLGWSVVGAAGFHAAVSLLILFAATWLLEGHVPATAAWLPVIMLPLVGFALGAAWFISALGVFIRDIGQLTGVFAMVLMFLAPIFYPIDALPAEYRDWLYLNPLTVAIEEGRAALFAGRAPDPATMLYYAAISLATMCGGYWWFQKSRRGFADVL